MAAENSPRPDFSFNAPELGRDDEPTNKPVETALQALEVYRKVKRDNRARAERTHIIEDHYNGKEPFSPKKLVDAGQGWRANFPTGFLESVVDRITPQLVDVAHTIKFLTASKLPTSFPDSDSKTLKFRERTTDLIRNWLGWNDVVDTVARENVLHGYTAVVQMDPNNWRPRTFRQEEILFDEQTRQHAGLVPFFAVEVNYFIHELVAILKDSEAAETAGYNLDALRHAIQKAMPKSTDYIDKPREFSDVIREANLFASFHPHAKVVETVHLFVTNFDGTVDHWWLNRNAPARRPKGKIEKDSDDDNCRLFHGEDIAKSMEEVLTLFSFQTGNNRLFGSKGLGRSLVNLDTAINRARMGMIDNLYLSGLIAGQCEAADIPKVQLHVRGPLAILPTGFVLVGQWIQAQPEAFNALINALTSIAEVVAGAYFPNQIQVSGLPDRTATEVSIDAQREDEIRTGILNRFWTQFTQMVSTIQKRIYSAKILAGAVKVYRIRQEAARKGKRPVDAATFELIKSIEPEAKNAYLVLPDLDDADPEAVATVLKLLEDGLSIDEIIVISQSASSEFSQNVGALQSSRFLQFYAQMRQNPNFDGGKMDEMIAIESIGLDRTKELYIPPEQPTTLPEQARAQYIELGNMVADPDQPIPVSARDDHLTHFNALMPKTSHLLMSMGQAPPEAVSPGMLKTTDAALTHGQAHLQAAQQKGADPAKLKAAADTLKAAQKAQQEVVRKVQILVQARARAQAEQQAQAQQQLLGAFADASPQVSAALKGPNYGVPPPGGNASAPQPPAGPQNVVPMGA
jgi:hypothetical protein